MRHPLLLVSALRCCGHSGDVCCIKLQHANVEQAARGALTACSATCHVGFGLHCEHVARLMSWAAGFRIWVCNYSCREALPGQAAIGELRAATQALQGRQDAHATRVAAVQSESTSLHASIQVQAPGSRPQSKPCDAHNTTALYLAHSTPKPFSQQHSTLPTAVVNAYIYRIRSCHMLSQHHFWA
jgi:hypothetical protein